MKKIKKLGCLVCLLLAGIATSKLRGAEGLRLLPESSEALGKIGGKFANLNDASVTRINPANLSYLDRPEIMFGATLLYGETDFRSVTGASEEMLSPWKYSGALYMAGPLEGTPVSLGLGISTPYGLDMKWAQDGAFSFVLPHDVSLLTMAITPGVAVQVTENLSLGVSFDVMWTQLKITQRYPWASATGVPGTPFGIQDLDAEGWGVTPTAALNWELFEGHHLAIIGKLPINVEMGGDYSISRIPSTLSPFFSEQSNFDTEIEFPGSVGAGYSVDLSERLRLGIDFEWIQNSTHDDLPLDIGVNQALLPADRVILDWKNSWNLGTGVEYDLSEVVVLRTGYLYSESPMPDRTFTPTIPANDRHVFSVGLGLRGERGRIDLAYGLGIYEDRSVRNNQEPAFNGNWNFQWDQVTISGTLYADDLFGSLFGKRESSK